MFDQVKRRARFARASFKDWKLVLWWLVVFGALFAIPCLFASGPDRVQWQGMFFQWAGVSVVTWGLIDTRRNLFREPPLRKEFWKRVRRLGYMIKPPPPRIGSMQAIEAGSDVAKANVQVRSAVTGNIEARIEALAKNQQRIDEELSRQQQAIERSQTESNERINSERSEREAADKEIHGRLKDAIIGGIHLEIAGVIFLFVGIAFTAIPNWIAFWLKFVGL